MPLLNVLLIIIVVGVLLWLVNTYIPMDRKIKNILNIVVVIMIVYLVTKSVRIVGWLTKHTCVR
jgi:hypothetical protein